MLALKSVPITQKIEIRKTLKNLSSVLTRNLLDYNLQGQSVQVTHLLESMHEGCPMAVPHLSQVEGVGFKAAARVDGDRQRPGRGERVVSEAPVVGVEHGSIYRRLMRACDEKAQWINTLELSTKSKGN